MTEQRNFTSGQCSFTIEAITRFILEDTVLADHGHVEPRAENGRASLPKTKNRKPRRVFLNKSSLSVLATMNLAGKGNDDLLFPGITQNRVSVQYSRCVKLSGVKVHRFHDLRHTAASHLHEEGLDDHTIAGLLGQKSIKTSRGYQHMSAKFLEQAAMRLDERLGEVLSPGSHPQATKPN